MSSKTIHVLHLSSHGLRWATLIKKGRECRIGTMGTIKGDVPDVLDRWLDQGSDYSASAIRLYDSRPLVFSFKMNLPVKAHRQLDDAIRLRIRSELGLGPETVYWTARTAPSAQDSQLLDVTVMVVRCDAMVDLAAWRDRIGLEALWVTPDFAAISALTTSGLIAVPAMVFNSVPLDDEKTGPADVYRVEASGGIFRNRVRDLKAAAASAVPGQSPPIYFSGCESVSGDATKTAGEFSTLRPESEVFQTFTDEKRLDDLGQFDPVVLGGVIEQLRPETLGRGLLESHLPQTSPLMDRLGHLKMKPLVLGAIVLAVLTAGSMRTAVHLREKARERVMRQASVAMREISALSSEEAILRQVKADRSPLIPVIEAIHEAAPAGIVLESLSIGDSGLIRMDGVAQNPDAPNQFFKALAEDVQLEKVSMPQVGNAPQGKGFRFQLTAQMKGRK